MQAGRDQELKMLVLNLPVDLLPDVVSEEGERRNMNATGECHERGGSTVCGV